jgi:hypothetical protein
MKTETFQSSALANLRYFEGAKKALGCFTLSTLFALRYGAAKPIAEMRLSNPRW